MSELAAELVRLNVDVIVTGGNLATEAVKKATNTIPTVMTLASDPIASGSSGVLHDLAGTLLGCPTFSRK